MDRLQWDQILNLGRVHLLFRIQKLRVTGNLDDEMQKIRQSIHVQKYLSLLGHTEDIFIP